MAKKKVYKINSFFSGIGGFDVAFANKNFSTKMLCEINPFCNQSFLQSILFAINPFCNQILHKHWPYT